MTFFVSLQTSSDDNRINGKKIDNPKIELLFHETTKNFDKLPIQYRVSNQTIPEIKPFILEYPAKIIVIALVLY